MGWWDGAGSLSKAIAAGLHWAEWQRGEDYTEREQTFAEGSPGALPDN